MTTAIARAPTPALACVPGITGKGCNGKAVIVLISIVVGRGVKTNINQSQLVIACATITFPTGKPITSLVTMCIFSYGDRDTVRD